jgi:hypothetical protein
MNKPDQRQPPRRCAINTIYGAVPLLNEDPADDPSAEELLLIATVEAEETAATRGMRAVDVEITERLPGLYDQDRRYVLDQETGAPIAPRTVMFRAEAVP